MIGKRIDELRKEKRITKAEIVEKSKLSRGGLDNIINEKTSPTIDTLEKIAKTLDVSVGYFIGGESEDCIKYEKGYLILKKYWKLKDIKSEVHSHQDIYEYFYSLLLEKEKYLELQNFKLDNSSLWDVFFIELFNIYEVQELFIKGYYTKETDFDTPEYPKWLKYEYKISVKSLDDAIYKQLPRLIIINIRKGYEKYFSKQIM